MESILKGCLLVKELHLSMDRTHHDVGSQRNGPRKAVSKKQTHQDIQVNLQTCLIDYFWHVSVIYGRVAVYGRCWIKSITTMLKNMGDVMNQDQMEALAMEEPTDATSV